MARIVIVDDDERLGPVLEDGLAAAGHKPVWARDAEELGFFLQGGMPDLAVIDMQFRGGGGPAASRMLAASVPVIVLSAMPREKQEEWFKDRARVRHFVKPTGLPVILKAVEELLDGA